MKDSSMKACVFGALIVACYGIYMGLGPGGDGAIFASVLGFLAGVGGFVIGFQKAKGE